MTRITRDELNRQRVELIAQRSTCLRGNVGAIILDDRRVISEGYNGAPPHQPQCDELGECLLSEQLYRPSAVGGFAPAGEPGCVRTIHAEANAIAWAARKGNSIEGCEMWCTHGPCYDCAKLIISSGIRKLTYLKEYRLQNVEVLDDAGVEVRFLG